MTNPCTHPRTATVTSQQHGMSDEPHVAARVCALPACVTEAYEWVHRMGYKQAFLVQDKGES